jgi:hypothetical protein
MLGLLVAIHPGQARAEPAPAGPAATASSSDEIEAILASGDRLRIEGLDARRDDVQRALALLDRDQQPERALLQIRNHTPYRTYIFVDGALTGWVGPYATYTLRGFVQSYYTLYIRTYYGTRYWGPRTMHLSGIYHLW